jgi:hypothetical protein
MMEYYLALGKILNIQDELRDSFNYLSPDILCYGEDTLVQDVTRFRHFSNLSYQNHQFIESSIPPVTFNQHKSFHAEHVDALPAAVNPLALSSLQQIVGTILQEHTFAKQRYHIGFNQIRMLAKADKLSYVAPTYHQDGYDFSLHICVTRDNVIGGISKLARDAKSLNPVNEITLQNNEYILFDDKNYYHTATPIQCATNSGVAYRDMVIVDIIADLS